MPSFRLRFLAWFRGYPPVRPLDCPEKLELPEDFRRSEVTRLEYTPEWIDFLATQRLFMLDGLPALELPMTRTPGAPLGLHAMLVYCHSLSRRDHLLALEELFSCASEDWSILATILLENAGRILPQARSALGDFLLEGLLVDALSADGEKWVAAFEAAAATGIASHAGVGRVIRRAARSGNVKVLTACLLHGGITPSQVRRVAHSVALIRRATDLTGPVRKVFHRASLALGFHPGYEDRLVAAGRSWPLEAVEYAIFAYVVASRPRIAYGDFARWQVFLTVHSLLKNHARLMADEDASGMPVFADFWLAHTPPDRVADLLALWDTCRSSSGVPDRLWLPEALRIQVMEAITPAQAAALPLDMLVSLVAHQDAGVRHAAQRLFLKKRRGMAVAAEPGDLGQVVVSALQASSPL